MLLIQCLCYQRAQPTMEYMELKLGLLQCLSLLPESPSQVWNTQWNTLVTEQELKLGFLQCLSLLPESPSQVWNTQWNTLVTEQELKLGVISQCFNSERSLLSSRPWLHKINYDDLHMLSLKCTYDIINNVTVSKA